MSIRWTRSCYQCPSFSSINIVHSSRYCKYLRLELSRKEEKKIFPVPFENDKSSRKISHNYYYAKISKISIHIINFVFPCAEKKLTIVDEYLTLKKINFFILYLNFNGFNTINAADQKNRWPRPIWTLYRNLPAHFICKCTRSRLP